jgi:class I fructose-bisphosphate aldolase
MDIASLLGDDASLLLDHKATAFPKEILTIPGPNYINDVFTLTDRSPVVLRNLGTLYGHGRLGGTGYLSILPVDQGIEHSAAASFAPNPEYFDPARLCDLAIEAGCNAIASTLGTLGSVTRRYVHRIPFIVKINHNDLLRYPTSYDQHLFASARQAVRSVLAPRSTSVRRGRFAKLRKSRLHLPRRTGWVSLLCSGRTCVTTPSSTTALTTT